MSLYQELLARAKKQFARPDGNDPRFMTTTRSSDGDQTYFDRSKYNKAMHEVNQQRADWIGGERDSHYNNLRNQMIDTAQKRKNDLAAAQSTAVADFNARNQQLAKQADITMNAPNAAPISVPTQAPINAPELSLNAGLSGTNAATNDFFISPESTQSQFSVGAPVGSGIGGRQKQTTQSLTSEPDTLGAKQKDEL